MMGIKIFAGFGVEGWERKKTWTDLGSNMYFEMFHFVLRYDIIVSLSNRNPATGGGENYKRNNNYLYRYRRGRCDLPSHLQMAR